MRGLGGYGWGTEMRGARPGSEVVSKMCKGALGRRESDFNLLRADIFPVTLLRHKLPSHFLLSTTTPQILLSPHHIAPKQFSNLGNSHHSCASSVAVKKRGNRRQKFGPFLLLRQSSCHKTVLSDQQQQDYASLIHYTLFYLDLKHFPCKRDKKKGLQSKPSRYHSSSLPSKLPFPSTCLTSH